MAPPTANKTAHSGFKTQRRSHQKSKTCLSVAPQEDLYPPKILSKKSLFSNCYDSVETYC